MRPIAFSILLILFLSGNSFSQTIERVTFDVGDTTDGYYLAVSPRSKNIQGTLILMNSFATPDDMIPETKLQNVAYVNDLLVIFVSMKQKLYADTASVTRLNNILSHVVKKFGAEPTKFVLAGYDFAGNIALRYAELSKEDPSRCYLPPQAVMAVDSPVDLFGLWSWSERQIDNHTRSAGDGKYILDLMTREHGNPANNKSRYLSLTPFNTAQSTAGNEQYLTNIPVRLYYDSDIEWLLKNGRSFYDTNIPEGAELIRRLNKAGNKDAELITAVRPGMNSRGIRTTNSLSIVDEAECIQWIKNKLDIFDAHGWKPPYQFLIKEGWEIERFAIPIAFAPEIPYKGVEDIRFAPGWGDEKSDQYWSYTFLWWLNGDHQPEATSLQHYLKAYYQGLVNQNITSRKIPVEKIVPTTVVIKKIKTATSDSATYTGSINMLDYMTQRPIRFNCSIHVKKCTQLNKTAIVFKISPQAFHHNVWNEMNEISQSFRCK